MLTENVNANYGYSINGYHDKFNNISIGLGEEFDSLEELESELLRIKKYIERYGVSDSQVENILKNRIYSITVVLPDDSLFHCGVCLAKFKSLKGHIANVLFKLLWKVENSDLYKSGIYFWRELRTILANKHELVSETWFGVHHESIPLDDCSIHGYDNVCVEEIPGFLNLVAVDIAKNDEVKAENADKIITDKLNQMCNDLVKVFELREKEKDADKKVKSIIYQYEEGVASYETYYQKYVDKMVEEGRYLELLSYRGWLDRVMDYIVL